MYCIDPHKENRWHLHLCAALQDLLGLLEPPHFLVPCYTATIDHWLDPFTGDLRVYAEAYPQVLRYQPLLNAVFDTGDQVWQPVVCPKDLCDPIVLATHRQQFPELWQDHDLVVRLEKPKPYAHPMVTFSSSVASQTEPAGYVLRLFVSGHNAATERILQNLHQLLEQCLHSPYTLKVIDIFKHPEEAEADQIAATPTLMKVWPPPTRKLVGNLDDLDKVVRVLGTARDTGKY